MSSLNPWNHYTDSMGGAALWTAFGFSLFATVVFMGISMLNDKPKNTLINSLATVIVAITALAYLIEALGQTEMFTVRPLLWIRYAQWATNTPLLILTLVLLAGCTYGEVFFATALAELTTGALFAAAISSGYNATWPIYVFGVVAALPVAGLVLLTWSSRVVSAPAATKSVFTTLAWLEFVIAVGYAVNWGTAEGGKVQTIDQEVITYAVLDIVSRVVFGFILMFVPGAIEGAAGFLTTEVGTAAKGPSSAAPAAV